MATKTKMKKVLKYKTNKYFNDCVRECKRIMTCGTMKEILDFRNEHTEMVNLYIKDGLTQIR